VGQRPVEPRARATVLTRDPGSFLARSPHLGGDESIELVRGDVRHFENELGSFDAAVHAATTASAELNQTSPLEMIDTVVEGTRRVLHALDGSGAVPVLLTSTGAVYGKQLPSVTNTSEDSVHAPDPLDPASAYAEAKRMAELLGAVASAEGTAQVKIARCYAFVGPYLPARSALRHRQLHPGRHPR